MIRQGLLAKNSPPAQPKAKSEANLSILDFLKKGKEAIAQKADHALAKIYNKIIEEPNVYILPLEQRKRMSSQDRPSPKDQSVTKQSIRETSKSNGQLTKQNTERLHELMKKKHELMNRLRKIDQELYNPSMLPVTIESNNSVHPGELDKLPNFRGIESRLNLKQSNTYNLVQHERNIQMLTKINNEKMKRQERIVSQMKKKQEAELKKLEDLEKNKSRLQQSRQSRLLPILKSINKKETEKLQDTESAESNSKPYHSFQKEKEDRPNQFDELQDIQIGPCVNEPAPFRAENGEIPEIN